VVDSQGVNSGYQIFIGSTGTPYAPSQVIFSNFWVPAAGWGHCGGQVYSFGPNPPGNFDDATVQITSLDAQGFDVWFEIIVNITGGNLTLNLYSDAYSTLADTDTCTLYEYSYRYFRACFVPIVLYDYNTPANYGISDFEMIAI